MGDEKNRPAVFSNRFADAVGPQGPEPSRDHCRCVGHSAATRPASVEFHGERQDTSGEAWQRLLALIDEAAADGRALFKPFVQMSAAHRRQIVTLPPTIAKLTEVRHLVLYGTNLVRIPPEIGAMTNLEEFDPYTSHRLHWYPYELTRCTRLRSSTVSTRVLYGNFKFRPPFPSLRPVTTIAEADFDALDPGVWGADRIRTCSVCDQPVDGEVHQVWISQVVGTDVLPFLVNACSRACVANLPEPYKGYVPTPHTGGPDLVQPPASR
ncbi:leucine-rich repeat domain-containing protein [Plantactinospora sp. S1510]|uniref:Leucine-rich repeat domain-containing protein n=1 Tax=Plantactinospora alkalitolerans TaxID=2789879 RepID=A0ABS0H343_9ACTN|nr:leucine-rich repeat domain-containing protein [Plantactinospora alkalitolerans]MBF9132885.1 leucine-rich repeat domain-containing protein [Plantactinospora alkalitolerans]